jgi:methionyl-tRNA formyltransferase
MNICILCATRRGHAVLEHLLARFPNDRFWVASFREEPHEPPFLDAIRSLAERHGARFFETRNIASAMEPTVGGGVGIDVMLAVSWRYLIPMQIAARAARGCYIIHDSLLPAYRGFSPTVWAMINGEPVVGATLFHAAETVDSGDIVDQVEVEVGPTDRIGDVMDRVTKAYIELLDRNLPLILQGDAPRYPQDELRATYTCKRLPWDNHIDWTGPTRKIYNLIRAVTYPYPGAYTELEGKRMVVWDAEPVSKDVSYVGRVVGRVVKIEKDAGVVVLTGDGQLMLKKVQVDGEPERCASDVITSLTTTLGCRESPSASP